MVGVGTENVSSTHPGHAIGSVNNAQSAIGYSLSHCSQGASQLGKERPPLHAAREAISKMTGAANKSTRETTSPITGSFGWEGDLPPSGIGSAPSGCGILDHRGPLPTGLRSGRRGYGMSDLAIRVARLSNGPVVCGQWSVVAWCVACSQWSRGQ